MSEGKHDGTNQGALWGGRFASGPSPELAELSRSTHFDWALAPYDLAGSHAHAAALEAAGYLTADEAVRMHAGLDALAAAVADGSLRPAPSDEDVHGALEQALISEVGAELGGKLRAGRSRNDQIATLVRLYLLDHARTIAHGILRVVDAIVAQSEAVGTAVMPGRTHLQHAQPVLLAHHLQAHAWPLVRDLERLRDWSVRARVSPYGGGALAGATLGLDPQLVADRLGLDRPAENSIDGTSARDVVAEFAFIAAMIGVDLSRFSEDVIIWNTKEFGFVRLDDGYSTGSSIMPQKKNPDIAELTRGKAGRLIGDLAGLLATLKGLPLAYSKDMQEDKEQVFDSAENLELAIAAMTGMVRDMTVRADRMRAAAGSGYSTATDLADWLVRKAGLPFRDAHHVTGRAVALAEQKGCDLGELSLADLKGIHDAITEKVFDVLSVDASVASRTSFGGTAPSEVRKQIAWWRARN